MKTTAPTVIAALLFLVAPLKAGQPFQEFPRLDSADALSVAAKVDELLDASFRKEGTAPVGLASDEDFLRRVYLDLAGRIPTPADLGEFRNAPDENNRSEVIDRLLETEDYAKTWASYWRQVIFSRATEVKSRRSEGVFEEWMTSQLNNNRPWNEITTDLLTATGDTQELGSTGFLFAHNGDPAELAGETSRIFLGIQIQCANCHNHPYDQWKREDFHELAAFFPRIRVRRDDSGDKRTFIVESADNERSGNRQFDPNRLFKLLDKDRDGVLTAEEAKRNKQSGKRFERLIELADKDGDGAVSLDEVKNLPRPSQAKGRGNAEYYMPDLDDPSEPGTKTVPVFFVDDASVPFGTKDVDRRSSLANAVTSPHNPWFARAFVNRIWSEMLGEGFSMPIDDMGPERQAQLPEVLDTLAAGFVANDFDIKWLFRTIANTQAYQRSVQQSDEQELPTFASMTPTRLRGDQIFNSVVQVLGGNADRPRRDAARLQAMKKGKGPILPGPDAKDARKEAFTELFNYDPSTPQADLVGSIPQALFMMNSPVTNNAIQAQGRGLLSRLLSMTDNDDRALQALYIRVLSREPTDVEREICHDHIAEVGDRGEAFEDILWSLLNSSEFLTKR